jgi:hypothetical protein
MKTHNGQLKGTSNFIPSKNHEGQFNYLGRWVDKHNFRTFVYNKKLDQKLAESYEEFESLLASGIWFAAKPSASKERKQDNDISSSNSK